MRRPIALVLALSILAGCKRSAPGNTATAGSSESKAACTPAAVAPAFACNEKRVTIDTRAGVTLAFDLVEPSTSPKRAVILLSGGDGKLSLSDEGMSESASHNFAVRIRQAFASEGVVAAVPDVPSDQPNGLEGEFRSSKEHADDMRALIAWLDAKYHVPVWMVATSRGTISAANAAARLGGRGPHGIVLTSPVTVSENGKDSLAQVDLATIQAPCQVVSHAEDDCPSSPPGAAQRMAEDHDWSFISQKGGSEKCADAKCRCGPASHHGFEGLDGKVLPKILAFMNAG